MAAPRILWRAIARDVTLHALLGFAVITLLLVVQNALRFLEELSGAGLSFAGLAQLVGIILPSYLPYGIPTAMLFGVLLSFGRMSADGEIVAMRASGVSVWRMLPPVLALGLLGAATTALLMFEIEPQSHRRMKMLVRELGQAAQLLEPGRFRKLGDRTLYVHEAGDESCPLRGIVIGDFTDRARTRYVAAECAVVKTDPETDVLELILTGGSIDFEAAESDRYRRARFEEARVRIDLTSYLDPGRRARDHTLPELIDVERRLRRGEQVELRGSDGHLEVLVEIHRRLAFPLASLVLVGLAVPLGIRPLRAGRSWGALTAIAVMTAYWGLGAVGEVAALSGRVPVLPAMWFPDAAVAVLAVWLLRRTTIADA
jgi:lipopolysaccharide export system permease protein